MRFLCTFLALAVLASIVTGQKPQHESTTKQIIVVLGEQRLYAVSNKAVFHENPTSIDVYIQLDYSFHCSTGRKGMATTIGKTSVQGKLRHGRALAQFGGGALEYVLRVHLYDKHQKRVRRIDIHAYKSVPDHPASHGCIRLKRADAKKLFAWAKQGMDVEIVQKRPVWLKT